MKKFKPKPSPVMTFMNVMRKKGAQFMKGVQNYYDERSEERARKRAGNWSWSCGSDMDILFHASLFH